MATITVRFAAEIKLDTTDPDVEYAPNLHQAVQNVVGHAGVVVLPPVEKLD
jgi:hypothetical protein